MKSIALLALASLLLTPPAMAAEPTKVVRLWPNGAPDETKKLDPERDLTKPTDGNVAGKPVIRLGNVSTPTIAIYRPSAANDTGAAVVVCPGGGYHILAMDLEGTEVCEWLNSVGVTGVLLKYRVPKREGLEKHAAPLQDAQRAIGLVRQNAKEWGVDPKRVGILGFSAGGHLAAATSNNFDERTYPKVDEADAQSCRPDFSVLIYPAYLVLESDDNKTSPELKVGSNTPPTFIAMTADDPVRVENGFGYAKALKKANVPVELHIYPHGGHGYGLRRTKETVTTWPDRVADWMGANGWLKPAEGSGREIK